MDAANSSVSAPFELISTDSHSLLPFRLHAVHVQAKSFVAVLAATPPASLMGASSSSSKSLEAPRRFQIVLVRFPRTSILHDTSPLQQILSVTGSDLPSYIAFTSDRCCIGSACLYRLSTEGLTADLHDAPKMRAPEIDVEDSVGIPQANISAMANPSVPSECPPPPYSWNQTSDSVTVVFPLPSTTSVKDIRIVFRPTAVSLALTAPSGPSAEKSAEIPLPKLLQAKLWDEIDAGISTWTWERTGAHNQKYGILSLHLEKRNEDTRWPHVFKQDANIELDKAYLEVEETLDRSELLKITEALEKFTQNAGADRTDGIAGFEQRSSLLGEELDMDVDASEGSEGKGILFTWVEGINTDSPALVDTSKAEMTELVSLPISSFSASANVITKHDVDGLLFSPPVQHAIDGSAWKHTSTYPALAFVLASKRDVVQVYHYEDRLCIGLEAGSPLGSTGANARGAYSSMRTGRMNAYLYYPPPPGSKAMTAKQKVVGLADPGAGAVLGAIAIDKPGDKVNIAILCENLLVMLRDVL